MSAMNKSQKRKGSKKHASMVMLLTMIFATLVYWLLGFLVDDIGARPGSSFQEIERKYQDDSLLRQRNNITNQQTRLKIQMNALQKQLVFLQTSIKSYRDTMNQLLDFQKANASKSNETLSSLNQVTKNYLEYQQKVQTLNQSIANNNLKDQMLESSLRQISDKLAKQSEQANKVYLELEEKHHLILAALQLLLLIPLLLIAAYFFMRYKQTIYKPLFIALNTALVFKIAQVMHEQFPSRYFKYIFLLVLIALTLRALIAMLRMASSPKPDWLYKQYQESYPKMQCPECQYPIQPGILQFIIQQPYKKEYMCASTEYLQKIDTYSCPSCGERLFEPCAVCSHTTPSLLNYCSHCGVEKKHS